MKRSLGISEKVIRAVVPSTRDTLAPATNQAPDREAESAETDVLESAPPAHAPMAFPGPFAYQAMPLAMLNNSSQPPLAAGSEGAAATDPVSAALFVQADVATDPHGHSLLMLAAFRGDLAGVDALLQNPALDINQIDQRSGLSALMVAAVEGHREVVARLIAAGADPTLLSYGPGAAILLTDSKNAKLARIALLQKNELTVKPADAYFQGNALMLASGNGHVVIVKMLLAHGCIPVDQTNDKGWSALHIAAFRNKPGMVAYLLTAGANVNLADRMQVTALMVASLRGFVDIVKTLLAQKGIAVDQVDADGMSALHMAAFHNKLEVMSCLLGAGANGNLANGKKISVLMNASSRGHVNVVKMLLAQKGVAVDQLDANSLSALHWAVVNNKPDAVACLLGAGANVNLVNGEQVSVLMKASSKGHVDIVKMLLAHGGIVVDQFDAKGQNALHLAANFNRPEVAACLLEAGARINLPTASQGFTALLLAASHGHVNVLKILLAHRGVALDQPDASGKSALHWAASGNRVEAAACLLRAGAKASPLHRQRYTPLMTAVGFGHVDVIKLLIRHDGFDAHHVNIYGNTALHLAVMNNNPDVVACLLSAGADVMLPNMKGVSAKAYAFTNQKAAVVEVMLQFGLVLTDYELQSTYSSFSVTVADLVAARKSSAAPRSNASGLSLMQATEQPLVFIDELIDMLASGNGPLPWLRAKDIRQAIAPSVFVCLANLAQLFPKLANSGQAVSRHQERLLCAAALSRLPVLGANEQALAIYKAAGISAAGLEALSQVATRQIEQIVALAEKVLSSIGEPMLENLVAQCIAGTDPSSQVDADTLTSNLVNAGWLPPLARAVALAWKSALSTLESDPLFIPAGSTVKQITQLLRENIERKAPRLLAQALQRELALPALIATFRTLIGDLKAAEALDMQFQIQVDQLRQFCEQTGGEG
jgi:ankyrin repeat protein